MTVGAHFRHELQLSVTPSYIYIACIFKFISYITFTFKAFGTGLSLITCSHNCDSFYFLIYYYILTFFLQFLQYITMLLPITLTLVLYFLLSKHNSTGKQEDEFNIMLHNILLPSCLQLKRIFQAAVICFHVKNHSFTRGKKE